SKMINRDRENMINYGKNDESLFANQNDCICDIAKPKPIPYIFDFENTERPERTERTERFERPLRAEWAENDDVNCGLMNGFNAFCSYMRMSDDYFETFTEKSMSLTVTLFKFVKVMDEFSVALELLLQSWIRIRNLIL
ncbi:MAG: hypothetical protein WD512_02750, partial [Candidatus Paceibacterota bacterium]